MTKPALVQAPALLSAVDAGKRLDVSWKTVHRLISEGHLRAVDVGRHRPRIRIREDDLLAFIESRTTA